MSGHLRLGKVREHLTCPQRGQRCEPDGKVRHLVSVTDPGYRQCRKCGRWVHLDEEAAR